MNAKDIRVITCFGTGVIGSGWATLFAMKGYETRLYDISDAQLQSGMARVRENLEALVEHAVLDAGAVAPILARICPSTSPAEALQDADFVQESVPENLDIKKSIIDYVDQYCRADTIFSSSTSALPISRIAALSRHPERCIGSHPFNPPHLVPLVELTGTEWAPEALETAFEFYKLCGKEPVKLLKECPGFIATRLQGGVLDVGNQLIREGICTVEAVDKATTFGPGMRWGFLGPYLCLQLNDGDDGNIANLIRRLAGDRPGDPMLPYADMLKAGVDEELSHRDPAVGNTNRTLRQYRDAMLIEMLKLHGKITETEGK